MFIDKCYMVCHVVDCYSTYRDKRVQERQSLVNVRKLVKDLADMHPDHPFDVVIAELVANSLDSKAKSIALEWDDTAGILCQSARGLIDPSGFVSASCQRKKEQRSGG